jgi:pimeloyl-ACP methyl ester carboxylesterase
MRSPESPSRRSAVRVALPFAAGAVAVMALLAAPVSGSSTSQPRLAPDGAHLVHTKCPPGLPSDVGKIRCDFLVVPENHANPSGPKIRLMVARIPAVSSHPSGDPIVYLNGGPGSNAIGVANDLTEAGFNQDHELIVLTQRGTYAAHPLIACRSIDNFRANSLDLELYGRRAARRLDGSVTRCKRQLRSKGIHLADFNTLESTADVVDLRKALGIKSWDVFSHSYGTDLALTYMRLHPQGIRSVVLDGTVPPSKASLGWTWSSFKESFANMMKACRAQKSCQAHFPHTGRTYLKLVNRLQAHPITTRVKVPDREHRTRVKIDGGVLVNWLTRQSHFSSTVPLEIHQLAHGDPHRVAKEWAEARALPHEHRGNFAYGLSYGIWCSEWVPFESRKQELRKSKRAFPGMRRSVRAQAPQLTFLRQICERWNVPDAPGSIRDVTHSSIPTLAITGTFDAQTGAHWGSYAARTLSNSTVVRLPGVSHGAFANPCGAKVINSFFDQPDAADTRCVRHVHPNRFVVNPPHQGR